MERMTIGQRIEYLRKERGLSVAKLASQAHIPASTLHYVENGARDGGRLSVETAMRLARALGVSLDYLCGMYDGLPPKAAEPDMVGASASSAV